MPNSGRDDDDTTTRLKQTAAQAGDALKDYGKTTTYKWVAVATFLLGLALGAWFF